MWFWVHTFYLGPWTLRVLGGRVGSVYIVGGLQIPCQGSRECPKTIIGPPMACLYLDSWADPQVDAFFNICIIGELESRIGRIGGSTFRILPAHALIFRAEQNLKLPRLHLKDYMTLKKEFVLHIKEKSIWSQLCGSCSLGKMSEAFGAALSCEPCQSGEYQSLCWKDRAWINEVAAQHVSSEIHLNNSYSKALARGNWFDVPTSQA